MPEYKGKHDASSKKCVGRNTSNTKNERFHNDCEEKIKVKIKLVANG